MCTAKANCERPESDNLHELLCRNCNRHELLCRNWYRHEHELLCRNCYRLKRNEMLLTTKHGHVGPLILVFFTLASGAHARQLLQQATALEPAPSAQARSCSVRDPYIREIEHCAQDKRWWCMSCGVCDTKLARDKA